jgi:hypothetical protein
MRSRELNQANGDRRRARARFTPAKLKQGSLLVPANRCGEK